MSNCFLGLMVWISYLSCVIYTKICDRISTEILFGHVHVCLLSVTIFQLALNICYISIKSVFMLVRVGNKMLIISMFVYATFLLFASTVGCISSVCLCCYRALLHFLDPHKFSSKEDFVENYKNLSSFNEIEVIISLF